MRSISSRTAFRIILVSLPLLGLIGCWVTYMAVTQQEEEILLRGKALAKSGAATYGTILQRGLETGILKWDDLAHPQYTEIHLDVNSEPRYKSTFDWYTDQVGIQHIEDAMTASDPMLLYTVGNDLTGYIPTTLSAFSHPPTGDLAKDAVNARSKRRFTSPMHKAAAEWIGNEPLIQEYHRDTGDVAWDIAYPIWIRNPTTKEIFHWGSFRVGVRQDKIAIVRKSVMTQLILGFVVFEIILSCIMYLLIRVQLHPLRLLADKIDSISRGENEETIAAGKRDAEEVLMMAASVRRLQTSLRHAMSRLDSSPDISVVSENHPPMIREAPR